MSKPVSDLDHLREALAIIRARSSHRFAYQLKTLEPVREFTNDWRNYAQPEYLSLVSVRPHRIFFRFIQNVPHRTLLVIDASSFDEDGMCPDRFVCGVILEQSISSVVIEVMRDFSRSRGISFFLSYNPD